MNNFIILTDTGSDLEKELREKFDIEYVPMRFSYEGKDYEADLDWPVFSAPEFYNRMREGGRFLTAQVNAASYQTAFEKFLSAGKDVLYISCSSALSASIHTARRIAEETLKAYPERKIICIDGLRSCYALGLIAIHASELRAEGKTIEEVASWVEENKLTVHMIGSVDKLTYLKQAGRVSAASAFFGGLLNIKPIIIADAKGQNFAAEKVKGRKNAMARMVEIAKENYVDVPYQRVFISHTDCLEEAEELKAMLLRALGKDIDVHIGYIGPCVGASTGPDTLSINFHGKKVEVNA